MEKIISAIQKIHEYPDLFRILERSVDNLTLARVERELEKNPPVRIVEGGRPSIDEFLDQLKKDLSKSRKSDKGVNGEKDSEA